MLASQVAASLDNIALLKEVVEKRVLEEELNIARSIQLNLLPSEPPVLERFEVAALSISSKQVGGDYYDFLRRGPLSRGRRGRRFGKGVARLSPHGHAPGEPSARTWIAWSIPSSSWRRSTT